jgi:hypothetical protein
MGQNSYREKIIKFGLDLPGPIVILPTNLEDANSKDELFYSFADIGAIKFFRKSGNETMLDTNIKMRTQFSAESELFNVFNILITNLDEFTKALIIGFLVDLAKGKFFINNSKNVKVKIYEEKEDQKLLVDYEGSQEGLNEIIDKFKK